jgi:hypothetical protein
LNADPDPDPGFSLEIFKKILQLKKSFVIKNCNLLFQIGFQKERPSHRRSLQPSKEKIQHFRT